MRITLVSHYDEKEANVNAKRLESGALFISHTQINSAANRAQLIQGDFFDMAEQDFDLLYQCQDGFVIG